MRIFGLHILTNKQMEETEDAHKRQRSTDFYEGCERNQKNLNVLRQKHELRLHEVYDNARDHQRQISTAMVSEFLAENHRLKEQLRKKIR